MKSVMEGERREIGLREGACGGLLDLEGWM